MKIRKILSDKWWIHPDSEEIDKEAWGAAGKAAYFDTDYNLPPLKAGCSIDTCQAFLIGGLTKAQYNQQLGLQLQSGFGALWMEFVIRYGVRDWKGMAEQKEDGQIVQILPVYEDGTYGRMLTQESYENLVFFCLGETISLAFRIFTISQK